MEHEPRSLKEKIFDYFNWRKDLKKHAEKAIQIFCPNIVEQDKNYIPIDDVIQKFRMASECMRKIYLVDGKCWHDQKEFSNFVRLPTIINIGLTYIFPCYNVRRVLRNSWCPGLCRC
jgi:hypothetical protein